MKDNSEKPKKRTNWYKIFLFITFIIIIISIIIPVYLIELNHELNGCGHHTSRKKGLDGDMWVWGRALGFTSVIWIVISVVNGFFVNRYAKFFHSKKKARNFHCITSVISNITLGIHILLLRFSEPWRSVFESQEFKHYPENVFRLKILTGVIFAIIMVSITLLSIYLRKPKKMKKFGYKRFIWLHRIMLILTILLMIHIYVANTEIWIMSGEKIMFGRNK